MSDIDSTATHDHVFLSAESRQSERRTWRVIWLCGAMMLLEITGGLWFGSIALVADGLHMSTHASALLLAALAYGFARRHAQDRRFTFGTGKLGDLAGFTSAIILAMISILIGYEALSRFFAPVPIHFAEAIPIACLGLCVNIASAWLLSGGGHGHSHGHDAADTDHDESKILNAKDGTLVLEIFEDGVPPRFRLHPGSLALPAADETLIATIRPDGMRQSFSLAAKNGFLESVDEIPEPHAFAVEFSAGVASASVMFEEHEHAGTAAGRDNNMRAALVHVVADAAVSVLVIIGLILAKLFGWLWMDPLAGIIGAGVIANWAFGLIRDTGGILVDMNPDQAMAEKLRQEIETDGDRLADLHLWRLGPGHLGAIICVATKLQRGPEEYRARLARFRALSHLTIEVRQV